MLFKIQHDSGQARNMSVEVLMAEWYCVTTDRLCCLVTAQRGFSGEGCLGSNVAVMFASSEISGGVRVSKSLSFLLYQKG